MWPLPEPVCPTDDPRWDPPTLVRLALDHGLDRPAPRPPTRQARPWGTSRTGPVVDGVE
ncbi:hypothetical protein SAMN05660199_03075 [Klenkia soli]|uniref:Uncharacterized protein n=1 Tax=Klenkia soli TaxID=1052260 RepID=A0A1H0PGI4_9ACTN|nr:hypothetical protein [Klenkia soli]SDP03726.1 hypothetical protein SAMN05660199_03075 [Klenkia soli]